MMLFMVATFMVSCATTQNEHLDPYANITIQNVKNNCKPAESWNVGVLGRPAVVVRFDNCLDVKMLLVVATDENTEIEKIRRPSMELLTLHYIEYLKRVDPKGLYSNAKIKEEVSEGWLTFYYTITYTKAPKP